MMRIIVGEREIILRDYRHLDDKIDTAFAALFVQFLSDPKIDFANLVNIYFPPFEMEMFAFFDRNPTDSNLQDGFYTNLTYIWKIYLEKGLFDEAQSYWKRIIGQTRDWEQRSGQRVHKGSAFYFWAVPALLKGQIDNGFFLLHSSFDEDVLTSKQQYPNTPAFMFITLDFTEERQFLFGYVKSLTEYINHFFVNYRLERISPLTIEEFQKQYLKNPPSIQIVFSLIHSLVKLRSMDLSPSYILQSEFAGQYELNLLFDVILVIDGSIKSKDPEVRHKLFIDFAEYLAISGKLDISRRDLIYAFHNMQSLFDKTISDLLDGVFIFEDGKSRSKLGCDLIIAYCLRNHAAHNLSAFPTIAKRFQSLKQSVMNILLLTVDVLYK